jgi:predicted RNase H-like HicB family nuclease
LIDDLSVEGRRHNHRHCDHQDQLARPDIMENVKLTAVFMKVREGYVGFVEELPGANTQGMTLEEARDNLTEAVALVLDSNRTLAEESLGQAEVIRETFIFPAA